MKKTISILLFALTLCGCGKWLDINDNPNYVKEAKFENLLPAVQLNTIEKVGYDLALYGSFWSHYVVQYNNSNQYYTIMTNNVTNSTFNSPWSYFYARILPGVKEIIDGAVASESANWEFVGKTILAYDLYMLTSLYDKVAYSEGFLTESLTPHFDSGEDIQLIIIGLLEEVRAMDPDKIDEGEANRTVIGYDMFFGGDLDLWREFANTLYLKVMLRDFNANRSKIQNLLNNSAADPFLEEDTGIVNFLDAADKSNPLYESDRRQLNTAQNIRACSDVINFLDPSDPRIKYYYEPIPSGNNAGQYGGAPYGTNGSATTSGRFRLSATDPVYIATVDEALFLQAEAYARLNNPTAAAAAYEDAVVAAFERLGFGSSAAALIAGPYAFTPGTVEENVEQIINQKWASNVKSLPIEAWFDINRTGYPAKGAGKILTDYHGILGAEGGYPVRFIYSKTSADYNPNSPAPEKVNVKMWWHKQ